MLGLKPKNRTMLTPLDEEASCWPYMNWTAYDWVDNYLEEASEIDYSSGVDCDVALDSVSGDSWIDDHTPSFNGEIFEGNTLASSSFWEFYSSDASTYGGTSFSAHYYNGGRVIEGLLELWLQAPAGMTWDSCNLIGLWYYACDGLGTSSLYLLLGTLSGSTGLTQACRDQSAPLNDPEMDRVSRPAPGTGGWASSQLVETVPAIVNTVMAFKRDLCSTSPAAVETFATARGQQLWETAVTEAKKNTANGDDRPLYWARLHMMAALRQWRPPVNTANAETDLDRASRGITSDNFSGTTSKKALISGFDPFDLDQPADGANAIMRGNPSAAAVLRLDGQIVGAAEVQAVILPVRYADFDAGLAEDVFDPHLLPGAQQATLINTVSQGGTAFEWETYYGRRRSSDPFEDNRNMLSGPGGGPGGTTNSPTVPAGPPALAGSPEFLASSLPAVPASCTACGAPYTLITDTHVMQQSPPGSASVSHDPGFTPGSWSVEGSGGGFLSNELPYRVALQRSLLGSPVPVGHVHTPALAAIPDPAARLNISAQYQRILTALLGEPQNATPPGMGISFTPTGDAGQCGNYGQQWVTANWTSPIRFDTDNRSGGCQLAFGISDPTLAFAGLTLSYRWQVSPGGDARQCGNQGEFQTPITSFQVLGPTIVVDADDKGGWCNLTFTMSGRNDAALDIQFWADGDAGQCVNNLPQGQYRTVVTGSPVTIGINTDGRPGGCKFSIRLRKTS